MSRWIAVLPLITACASTPEASVAPVRAPEPPAVAPRASEPVFKPGKELDGTPETSFSVCKGRECGPSGAPEGRGRPPEAADGMSCELRREQWAVVVREYELSRARDAETAARECQPTTRRARNVVTGGAGAPERAWICRGKLVDAPVSYHTSALEARVTDLKVWLREHCDAAR